MKRLRELRKASRLTQTQLAERAGVSQAYINDLENGNKTNPRKPVEKSIAEALGVTVPELSQVK